MTKRIEEVLNLMPIPEVEVVEEDDDSVFTTSPGNDAFDLLTHDKEMDDLYDVAMSAHKDMLELSFSMEPKNAGQVLEPAAKMLEIALKASQSKVDSRIKVAKSIMERDKVNYDTKKNVDNGLIDGETPNINGYVASRNEVLKRLRQAD